MKRTILILIAALLLIFPALAKVYDFSDSETEFYVKKSQTVTIPAGQIIYSRLNSNIASTSNKSNETVTTQLVKDWVYLDKTIAPEGSLISGKVTSVEKSGFAYGNAKVTIQFTRVVRPDNVSIYIQAKPIVVTIGESRGKNSRNLIKKGILNNVANSNSVSDFADNVVYGAISGGFVFLTTKGEEVNIPFGTEFKIHILNELTVQAYEN